MSKRDFINYFTKSVRLILILIILITGSIWALQAQTRIMPLGDSITGSPGCWRAILWNRLQDNGFTDIDFVGTVAPQGCGLPYDGNGEGHGGALATNVANQNQLVGWLSATNPDIVIMHFGTNDIWSGRSISVILEAFTTLVNQMRANNPNMKILVAQIIPMDSARSCSNCYEQVVALNNSLPGWASGMTTSQSPITVVDLWTGFDAVGDTSDGVHPVESGLRKMSDAWYPALAAALSGGPVPTPVRTPEPGPDKGDVNDSGSVDIIDALMVAQHYVGLPVSGFNSSAADVSGDGQISIIDALQIAQCYVGLISCAF